MPKKSDATKKKSAPRKTPAKKSVKKPIPKVSAVKKSVAASKPVKKAATKVAPKGIDKARFAVIKIGGTQLKVSEGGKYEIPKIEGAKGDKIEITDVLFVEDIEGIKVGKPTIEGAKVVLLIDSQKKGDKLRVFKYKAKARYRRTYGSREFLTRVAVEKIVA